MQPRSSGASVDHALRLMPYLAPADAEALIDLVRRHDVSWEVWPERQVVAGELGQIGFAIELFARHDEPSHEPMPGCPECQKAHASLARIAQAVLPREQRASRYDRVYGRGMTYPSASAEGLMQLTLKILHRRDFGAPPDACEAECLEDIEARLASLGARQGRRTLGVIG